MPKAGKKVSCEVVIRRWKGTQIGVLQQNVYLSILAGRKAEYVHDARLSQRELDVLVYNSQKLSVHIDANQES